MGFIDEYFLNPMGHYYTVPAMLLYGALFVIAIYLSYKYILKKIGLKIDLIFIISLIPFIIFGGSARALKDGGFYTGFFFMSPGIYVTVFFITLLSLLVSILVQKKFKIAYWKLMVLIGSVLVLFNVFQVLSIGIQNMSAIYILLGLYFAWGLAFFGINKIYPKLSIENSIVLFSQMMDATQTFIAVTVFGYGQQFPIVSGLTSLFGPWVIFPVKLIIVYTALYFLDKETSNSDMKNWIKIGIIILGMPMGIRGMLRLAMGV